MRLAPHTLWFSLLLLISPLLAADHPFPAFRIAGNLYYVGSDDLASYLVTTPQGDILIDPDEEKTVPLIRASVEKLGFHFKDIRILLISQAHFDHCESLATVQKMTGAKIFIMQGDAQVVASGGKGEVGIDHPWTPVKVDRVLHDNDHIDLGGVTLVAHLTPGHTQGCTTWTLAVPHSGKTYQAVIIGGLTVLSNYRLTGHQTYPGMRQDYEKSFIVMRNLPCDLFLGAHGGYFGLAAKYPRLHPGSPNPFVDPQGYQRYITEMQNDFQEAVKKQGGS